MMKFFAVSVFLCTFLVFVRSFPLEGNAEFEKDGEELLGLVRNKRQFNFPLPRPNFSGIWMGGGSGLGARGNYDVPLGGASVMATHDFASHGATRVGVEGRVNLLQDKSQTLTLSAGQSTNIGPGLKLPENTIGLSYSKSFK